MNMRKIIIYSFILLAISFYEMFSHPEVWMKIKYDEVEYMSTEIRVYEDYGDGFILHSSGKYSTDYGRIDRQWNAFGDMVGSVNSEGSTWNPMQYNRSYLIYVVDAGKYCKLDIGTNKSGGPDIFIEYMHRDSLFRVLDNSRDVIELAGQGNWNEKNITVKNSFNDGNVKIDSKIRPNGVLEKFGSPTFPHTLEAILGQESEEGYVQSFDKWLSGSNDYDNAIETSIGPSSATYTAKFSNLFKVTFRNQFPDGSNGGVIKVDGEEINSPTAINFKKEGESIIGEAVDHLSNGYHYVFDHWNEEGGNSKTYNFLPNDHKNYKAIYDYCGLRHLTFNYGAPAGTPIKLYWHKRQVPNITQYQIWRKAGKTAPQQLIATVSGSTTSYTDYQYVHSTGTGSDKLLTYDVRYYCSSPSGWASPNFSAIYGEEAEFLPKQNNGSVAQEISDLIEEYSISTFPNPFNPVTNIYYKVKEPGFVNIKVYDMLGKEVITLVNEDKPSGEFIVPFNGSNLASGIYFYTMQVNNYFKTQKMLLTK